MWKWLRLTTGYLLLLSPVSAVADRSCWLLAETYYEQLYCEVQAAGQGADLPSLLDFRRNNDKIQALLLRRPAARAGIDVAVPADTRLPVLASVAAAEPLETDNGLDGCQLDHQWLICEGVRYVLVNNLANSRLAGGVLKPSNKMRIPAFRGAMDDRATRADYLAAAYRQYLEKMMEIGLGGSTFSYAKFVYLFDDVMARGVDFAQRFETMFGFLKKDKQRLAVNESQPDSLALQLEHCDQVGRQLVVCNNGRKNYLFRRQD